MNKRLIKSNDEGGVVPPSFNTVLYTGTNLSLPITGLGFRPDLVWIKNRTGSADHHSLIDSVRGKNSQLFSNLTNGENTFTDQLDSFDSDGFTVGTGFIGSEAGRLTNVLGNNYVAWCWKAGGAAVTNTDGTITSQVSANTEAGFSVVSYTGNGVVSTVGHGLSEAPKVIIAKNRNDGAEAWPVYHSDLGKDKVLTLNTTDAQAVISNYWGTNGVNDTVFGITSSAYESINQNGSGFIAYCFAEVAGFSKFGSYVGTGVAGNFQDCGFEPAFIMFKASSVDSFWVIIDNKRNTTNPKNLALYPNSSSNEESLGSGVNFLPTGFDFPGVTFNSTNTYIYMAFANQF